MLTRILLLSITWVMGLSADRSQSLPSVYPDAI